MLNRPHVHACKPVLVILGWHGQALAQKGLRFGTNAPREGLAMLNRQWRVRANP